MEILKFDNVPQKRVRQKKSSTKTLVAAAGFAAIAVLGSTLAANISLNSGTLEFGQGVAVTASCDDDGITATPKAVFANSSGAGSFNFASIAFSGVKDTCLGKLFTLNAYGDTSATPLDIATLGGTRYNVATFVMSTTLGQKSTHITTGSVANSQANDRRFEIGFSGTQATSGAVYKITLQSSEN
jgi:hypothetical protein